VLSYRSGVNELGAKYMPSAMCVIPPKDCAMVSWRGFVPHKACVQPRAGPPATASRH
jgi:hypothetical protein